MEFWAGRGEWFCARERALLGEQGLWAAALERLAPYLATGWWTATRTTAELWEMRGPADEAIALTRARMKVGHPLALEFYTLIMLVQRERMQFHGYLSSPPRREESENDQSQV
ncbi:hypothetical protein ABZ869_29735 [Streptomyces sp. NPDC046928]|uniref:hypothetical protein n=1 Tax=Streptomyces sp. NPDC046928 TaxID=3155021 RepID=UPI0034049C8F